MKDFTIIIAHRGQAMGLWATIHSCEADLENSGYDYNYAIVTNGEEKLHNDTFNVLYYLSKSGKLLLKHHSVEPLSPPTARQLAADRADGKYLFFFDNHCLVQAGYFKRAIESMEKYGMDMLHSTTRFYVGEKDNFHYTLSLAKNFWAGANSTPVSTVDPYRILAAGHGGFAVRREVWNEVGGYWDGFKGYGGEEIYFDLKMAMFGKTNWIDPKMIHYHFAGDRGYRRHYTDEFYKNMLACANIIGGQDWMHRVYQSFRVNFPKMMTGTSLYELMIEAEEHSKEHAEWMASRRLMDLDTLLETSRQAEIAF